MMADLEFRLRSALRLVAQLPTGTREPELAIDPDGDISFEWYAGKDAQISVSVGPGHINWAAVLNGERSHDYAVLGDIPQRVLCLIADIGARMESAQQHKPDSP